MAFDHAGTVLSGVIPDRVDRLLYALHHLEPDHFRKESRIIVSVLEQYYDLSAQIIPSNVFADILSRDPSIDAASALMFEELFLSYEKTTVDDGEFRYAVEALKDIRATQETGEAITTSMEILDRGVEVEGVEYRGHESAREFLYSRLGKIDRLAGSEDSPEGDIRHEADDIRQEYAERKKKGAVAGVLCGIETIDRVTSGFQNGEFILVCAYTGEGKSIFSAQSAWSAAVEQGKNVFLATSETTRQVTRRRILSRHSRLEKFERPEGLNTAQIKHASLSSSDEKVYESVIDDITHNPTYGKIYIAQVPRGATLDYLEARLKRQQALWNIDLVVIDYLALLSAERRRGSQREEFADILKAAKVMSVTFDGGRGVPVLSPWAMSQTAYRDALKAGGYTLTNLAETSEAEKSPDIILTMLRDPTRANEVKMQFLKNRDGERMSLGTLRTDYRSTFIGPSENPSVDPALMAEGT